MQASKGGKQGYPVGRPTNHNNQHGTVTPGALILVATNSSLIGLMTLLNRRKAMLDTGNLTYTKC